MNTSERSAAFFACLIFLTAPLFAQTSEKRVNTDDSCRTLAMLGALIDGTFDGQKNETRISATMLTQSDDPTWDTLIDCSEATKKSSERTEALRVAAIWERLRADTFRKMYLQQVALVNSVRPTLTSPTPPTPTPSQTASPSAESQSAQSGGVDPILRAIEEGNGVGEREGRAREGGADALRAAIAQPATLVVISPDEELPADEITKVAAHNRALCDQVIVVTRLLPTGLTLEYGSADGRKFLRKNYPRTCLLQETARFAPGVPRYLLVYANSKNDFAGFQPVRRSTQTPIHGSGTVMNADGETWNFTYSGTEEATATVQTPYTVDSQTIFLNAYDEKGTLVSQRSFTSSTQTGGDPGYAAGYNAANLVSRIWSNPQRLAAQVLKDIQKDSLKYGNH